jgi:UDP-N-acetylmuramoyl-tripeptide--D-alanyl-D-alanine ligase
MDHNQHIQTAYQLFLKGAAICTDSRNIVPGCIFFALKGANFNGNLFASAAITKGAALAVVDESVEADPSSIIKTSDALSFLQDLARHHRRQLKIPVIAITGSNGKTTTKELFQKVLSSQYKTLCTKGNLNNHIGVPLTVLSITSEHQIAIVEMGANHQKEIELLCSIGLPTHVLITNVGKAHLEGFGGFEGVKRGKGEMYAFARNNHALVFINHDNHHLKEMLGDYNRCYRYGVSNEYDVTGRLKESAQYVQLEWKTVNDEGNWYQINSRITGRYNFENILSAVAAGVHFDINANDICTAVESYVPDNQRSQEILKGNNRIIMDAYNANPTSMEAALRNFSKLEGIHKAVFLGEMLELGDASNEEHEKIATLVQSSGFTTVVLVGAHFETAAGNIGATFFMNSQDAADWMKKNPLINHHILIKGSRGSKMELVLEAL